MALFSKKGKGKDAAAPNPDMKNAGPSATSASASAPATEDFSDFSESALSGAGSNGAADASANGASANGASGKAKKKKEKPQRVAKARPKGLKGGAVVGLNIGSDSIKAVELRAQGSGVVITALGMVPTPAESISNGVVMSTPALSRAVRDLFAQAGIKSRRVVTSVAGTGSLIVRVIEVPRMSDSELSANMQQDLDRYIPFPPSEVIMDFKALRELPTDPDAANMEVLLAAAQREIVDSHVKVVQDAKLTPQAIDVEPLAAARALFYDGGGRDASTKAPASASDLNNNGQFDYDDVSALVNIGATGSEISVLRGDVLVFTRSIPGGGNVLTQALADTLGYAWPDAERLKREMGDALPHAASAAGGYAAGGYAGAGYADAGAASGFGSGDFGDFGMAPAGSTVAGAAIAGTGAAAAADDWSDFDALATAPAGSAANAGSETQANAFDTPPALEAGGQTATGAAGAEGGAAESGDPFDLDFFNQGPRTDEPEEQHRQKDDADAGDDTGSGSAPAADADAFDFSNFDLADDAAPPTAASPVADADDAPLNAAPNFAFSLDDDAATDAASTGEAPAAPSFEFDLPDEPAPDSGLTAGSVSGATTDADVTDFGAASEAPPSAYDLGELGLPEQPAADAGAAPVFPDEPMGMAPPASSDAADDFDLSSLAATAGVTAGAAGAAGAFGGAGAADTDFGAGFGMDDFGVGLGGASAGSMTEVTPDVVYSILHPLLEELAGEVRRSLEYYASRYPDAAVRRIALVGGGASLKNIDAMFTQTLGIPTTASNPLARVPLRAPKLPAGYVDQNGTIFAVSLGLALRDVV